MQIWNKICQLSFIPSRCMFCYSLFSSWNEDESLGTFWVTILLPKYFGHFVWSRHKDKKTIILCQLRNRDKMTFKIKRELHRTYAHKQVIISLFWFFAGDSIESINNKQFIFRQGNGWTAYYIHTPKFWQQKPKYQRRCNGCSKPNDFSFFQYNICNATYVQWYSRTFWQHVC